MLCLFGDLAGRASLLDDQILGVGLDDPFELRVLVPGADEEAAGLKTDPAVGLRIDGQPIGAGLVRALTDEDGLGRRLAALLFELRDVLVDLAEERLVPCGPLLP